MKISTAGYGVACLLACWVSAAVQADPQSSSSGTRRYTIEQLVGCDTLAGLSFAPDARKLLFTSTRSGLANIYELPVSGGEPRQLTHSTRETIGAIGYFPGDQRILYTSDQGGNELHHIFVRELDGGVRDLTPGEKLKARFVSWAGDGRSFFVATNERDARFFDLYEYATAGYARRKLFENDQAYQIRSVSPDRRHIALSVIRDNATTDAYLYDTVTKKLDELIANGPGIVNEPQAFSHDGAALFYTTDNGHEFRHLVRIDLRTHERTTVLKPNWDVVSAEVSQDGRYLAATINEDARTRVTLFDAVTLRAISMPDPGPGTTAALALAAGAPLMAVVQVSGDIPGDLYLLNLKDGATKRLARALAPEISQRDLVPGAVVRFRSDDGLDIPGVLYAPRGTNKNARLPAVVSVHGGPGGESQIGYKPLIQYLVNRGYVVYELNNRGSSGSGKTFYHLDDHRHGAADLDDIVASKRMLVATAQVDPERIAIMGGSYGGYLTLAALTFRPDAFAAGVDMYGVSNWLRLLTNTPAWWEDLRRLLKSEMGDWEQDAEYLRKISPVFHAQRIKRPLLILQGANDPRVLPVESEDIVAKVRANGTPVEYVVFPDEGHGWRKKANQLAAYRAIAAFLDQHVQEK